MLYSDRHRLIWFFLLSFVLSLALMPRLVKAQSAEPTPYPTGPWPTNTPWPANTQPVVATEPPAPVVTQPPAPVDTQPPAPVVTQPADGATAAPTVAANTPRPIAPQQPTLSPQDFLPPTSTPDAEGVIYSVVKSSDSLWSIAAKAGITLQELLKLNNLPNENVFVREGDKLIIGYTADYKPKETAEATAISETPIATEGTSDNTVISETVSSPDEEEATPLPTETTSPSAELCLSAFDDLNQNSIRDEGEAVRPDVAFTIFMNDKIVSAYVSVPEQPQFCIAGLLPGAYRISRSRLPNEKLINPNDVVISLMQGSSVALPFGSVLVEEATPTIVATDKLDSSPIDSADPTQLATNSSNTILVAIIIATALLLFAVLIILLGRRPARN